MLLDTLNALSKAGRAALQTVCGLTVNSESVSLLDQGSLTFPALGDLVISGGGLNRVHLGCDSSLCMRLSDQGDRADDGASIERLASSFRWHLLADIAGDRPRGKFENLAVEPVVLRTRGVRTFSFRFVTPAGQLFLLAEVPSRLEWEQAQGSGFLAAMAESYLPDGWATGDALRGPQGVESFLVFLRKVEADVYFNLPDPGGETLTVASFLVEPCTHDGKRALKFGMKLPGLPQDLPFIGADVKGSVGLGDRSVEFHCQYLGRDVKRIGEAGELTCCLLSWPEDLQVVQKRRSFRLPLEEPIAVPLPDDLLDQYSHLLVLVRLPDDRPVGLCAPLEGRGVHELDGLDQPLKPRIGAWLVVRDHLCFVHPREGPVQGIFQEGGRSNGEGHVDSRDQPSQVPEDLGGKISLLEGVGHPVIRKIGKGNPIEIVPLHESVEGIRGKDHKPGHPNRDFLRDLPRRPGSQHPVREDQSSGFAT